MLSKAAFIKFMHMAALVRESRAICKSIHGITHWKLE